MDEQILEVEVQSAEPENTIKIANDVVATIAGIATADVAGVAGMSGGIAGGFAQILGKKQLTKGVKVEIRENKAYIDLSIIVEYGAKIPEVAGTIQDNVKEAVVSMTGLEIGAINVHVQGVSFAEQNQAAESVTPEVVE